MTDVLGPDGRLRVMREKCGSCIFGPHSPLRAGRFEELRRAWEQRGAETYQVCHVTSTWDASDPEDGPAPDDAPAVCRGFFDAMYLTDRVRPAALTIAERLGLLDLDYVPPESAS